MIFMSLLTLTLSYDHEKRFALGCCNLIVHLLFSSCIVWFIPKSGQEPPHIGECENNNESGCKVNDFVQTFCVCYSSYYSVY